MTKYTRKRYAGKEWHHPSVHALMAGQPSDRDPTDVVVERAREIVAKARALGWTGPPFDPVALASIESIRARPSDGPMECEALIRALEDGSLEIVWDDSAAPTRRNFSVFHELGHTIFPDAYEVVRHRSERRRDPEDELERLCDAAAAEMLMPADVFSRDLSERTLDGETVLELARRYAASPEAAARRIATVDDRECAVVLLTLRLKPTEERRRPQTGFDFGDGAVEPEPRLRVDYAVPSIGFTTRIPQHKSVPDDSCAYAASRGMSIAAIETWSTGSGSLRAHVHAIGIPTDSDGRSRALALLVPV